MRTTLLIAVLVGAGAFGATLGRLQQLPPDYAHPRGEESPGPVLFKHETHVDAAKPDCTGCHPTVWKITEAGATADGSAMTHKQFDEGRLCGACHDGQKSFKMSKCDRCHDVFADEDEDEGE